MTSRTDNRTICPVCMHHCRLSPGQYGICRARKNTGGRITCENYGMVTSLALDPVEKKPLRMFYPGSRILSVGSFGCNLKCPFCQNHEISMADCTSAEALYISPEALAEKAAAYRHAGNIGVAFTYNEPLVGYEYVRDVSALIKDAGMKTVLVTNGSISPEILDGLLPLIDAMNIDLKGFTEKYYKKLGGDLETVKTFISTASMHCHVELTTLVVPHENDSMQEMEQEAQWIASLNPSIPLHITRFFPRYRMDDRPATDVGLIHRLARTAGEYLENVFVGNC